MFNLGGNFIFILSYLTYLILSYLKEREAAARMFSGKKGEKLVNGAMKSKTNKLVLQHFLRMT
jgi:hypothetical protein